jgi:hypothetical protein
MERRAACLGDVKENDAAMVQQTPPRKKALGRDYDIGPGGWRATTCKGASGVDDDDRLRIALLGITSEIAAKIREMGAK